MALTDDLADDLARLTVEVINATGDDSLIAEIADAMGGYSLTLEEVYLATVRIRRAEQRGRTILMKKRAAAGLSTDE